MDETERYHAEDPAERLRSEGFDRVDDARGEERSLEEVFRDDLSRGFDSPDDDPFDPWTRSETVGD